MVAGTTPVETTGSGNTVTIEVQLGQAIAAPNAANVGLVAFDSADFTVDANGFVSLVGGGPAVLSVSGTANRITSTGGVNPVIDISAAYVGQASITTLGTITTGVWNGTAIGPTFGGTGQTTYATGDILYASAANTLSKLAATTNGFILTLVAGVPAWVASAAGVTQFSPDTGTDPVVPNAGLVDIQGQATPNVSGIQVTGGLNRLDLAMFSPFGGGDFGFVASDNGGTQAVFVENTSNTASSDATFSAIVGGTSAGDPYSHYVIPATRFYALGIDNSDSDTWKLTTDVSPVSPSTGTALLNITTAGAVSIIGNLSQAASVSGAALSVVTSNTSNTASSTAFHQVQVAGSTASDAYYQANISGGQAWTMGLDNSDADSFVISASATPGTTNVMRAAITGEINYPLQPAFLAYLGTTDTNATGDLTVFVIGSGNALTEVFDQGGDFVTTGTFTAPVTGRYYLQSQIYVLGGTSITDSNFRINTSNRNYRWDGQGLSGATAQGAINGCSTLADMDAGDTYTTSVTLGDSGGKIDDVFGSGTPFTWMSGYLVC